MEPPKPEQLETILANAPHAAPADVAEYERLLSAHFRKDPSELPRLAMAPDQDELRLKELERKLFGKESMP